MPKRSGQRVGRFAHLVSAVFLCPHCQHRTPAFEDEISADGLCCLLSLGGAMRELIERLVKALVDDPAAVQVRMVSAGSVQILEVLVAPADVGKVIGKGGATAAAIRTLMAAAAGRLRAGRWQLEIAGERQRVSA